MLLRKTSKTEILNRYGNNKTNYKSNDLWKEVQDVLIMVTAWFPPNKAAEVQKVYAEAFRKIPMTSEKTLVHAGLSDKEGMRSYHIYEIEKGKLEEAYNRISRRLLEFGSIEGYRYKVENLLTVEEVMAMMASR